MDNTTPAKNKRATAEFRLKIIDVFFAAYGAFISGLFCIAQYFWGSTDYFVWIASGFFFVTLLVTYVLSYSKRTTKSEYLLHYVQECANKVGFLNPLMLALGFILAITADFYILIVCIALEVAQLWAYILSIKKAFPNIRVRLPQKSIDWCKNNKPLLLTALFAIISAICWLFTTESLKLSDLCLNLLAGFISSGITIGVIDRIIRKQQEVEEVPLKKALYRDVQVFTSRLINLWQEIYTQSIANRTNITIEELFDPENILTMCSDLDLSCCPNVSPKQNWFTYIEYYRKDLVHRGEKILETYMGIAEPEIIQAIHFLINDSSYITHLAHVNLIHTNDIINKVPRPTLLGWHMIVPQEKDYVMIKQLLSWCRSQFTRLHSKEYQDMIDIYPIAERITLVNPSIAPTSIMSTEKKNAEFTAFKEWQERSAKK